MTIQEIEYLLTILSEGSINKASTKLYISQPALSKMIKKIEQEYDITLFLRTPGEHNLKLTGDGEIFFEQIRRISHEHEILLDRLKGKKERMHSIIRIGLSPRLSNMLSPRLIQWLHDFHPEVFIKVFEDNSDDLEKSVETGSLDMALVSRHIVENGLLNFEIINTVHHYIYLRRGSPAGINAVRNEDMPYPCLSLNDICNEVIAVASPEHRASQLISKLEKRSGITFRKRIENNPMNRIQLSDIGQCTTIISTIGLKNNSFDPDRLFCIAEEDSISIHQVLCCLPENKDSEQVRLMSEAFRAITADLH
ncbi:MAG: LysR family transcriptional regulator [Erysipelotrichaceae bacterium]|nr:LysR family transcriptional regulator [Erysipelotrichaceae bacterium]